MVGSVARAAATLLALLTSFTAHVTPPLSDMATCPGRLNASRDRGVDLIAPSMVFKAALGNTTTAAPRGVANQSMVANYIGHHLTSMHQYNSSLVWPDPTNLITKACARPTYIELLRMLNNCTPVF